MRVELRMEYEDYYEACRVAQRRRRQSSGRLLMRLGYAASALGFMLAFARDPLMMRASAILLVVFGLTLLIHLSWPGDRRLREAWAKAAVRMNATEIVADEEAISFSSTHRTARYHWAAFCDVIETRRLLLLRSATDGDTIIPKRSFATATEIELFRETARRHIMPMAKGFPVIPKDASHA